MLLWIYGIIVLIIGRLCCLIVFQLVVGSSFFLVSHRSELILPVRTRSLNLHSHRCTAAMYFDYYEYIGIYSQGHSSLHINQCHNWSTSLHNAISLSLSLLKLFAFGWAIDVYFWRLLMLFPNRYHQITGRILDNRQHACGIRCAAFTLIFKILFHFPFRT